MRFPRFYLVRQNFPDRSLKDLPDRVRQELERADLARRLPVGAKVAIAVGSRGIANIDLIVRETVQYFIGAGREPFIVPAMGSHGGASPEGQASVLTHYGITEQSMGCPVVSQLEVCSPGVTPEGIQVWVDRVAYEAAGILVINRVKWHTSFEGRIESGLFKMLAIGLGKLAGAQQYHAYAYRLGLEEVILSVARFLLATGKVLGGVGIVEDERHQTAHVEVIPAENLELREAALLQLAKSWMPRLPVPAVDVLIVDEIGKNISGTGMDTKIVNRSIDGARNPWKGAPRVERIFVRELSPLSYGNAVGIGMADVVTDRLVAAIDWDATYVNSLAASTPAGARLPLHFPTDRQCLERVATTVGKVDPSQVSYVWIRNTLSLEWVLVSDNAIPFLRATSNLSIKDRPIEIGFGEGGDLPPLPEVAAAVQGETH